MRKSAVFLKRKGVRSVIGLVSVAVIPFFFQSCDGGDFDDLWDKSYETASVSNIQESIGWANAIVTVKSSQSGRFYFQLDDDTTLEPSDWKNPFHKEVRALLSYADLKIASDLCSKTVRVERIDSLITKDANYIDIEDGLKTPASNEQVYLVDAGYKTTSDLLSFSDPVEIVSSEGVPDWLSYSEDGYLTIHFATYWGGVTSHSVNLYASKAHPDHLYFVHKNNGDLQTTWSEGLLAFKLFHMYIGRKDDLSSPRDITLHWLSFDGEKTAVFRYGKRIVNK